MADSVDRCVCGRLGVRNWPAGRIRTVSADVWREDVEHVDVHAEHHHSGGGRAVPAVDFHRSIRAAKWLAHQLGDIPTGFPR